MHMRKALPDDLGGAFFIVPIRDGYVDILEMVHESKLINFLFPSYAALLEGGRFFFRRLVFL